MNQQTKELVAILGGTLGYTPSVEEMRAALSRDGSTPLPRGTYYEWLKSGADRDTDSLRRVALYYDGRPDKDGNPINPAELRRHLETEFGIAVRS